MPKRKHSELENDADRGVKVNTVKAARLRHKFEHGRQELFRALKTARGFERQKLGRRQKTAKTDGDTKALERLAMEVHVLKALNLEETAERYLHKQLTKTKRILESPEFFQLEKNITTAAAAAATGPRDPAEANVTARLFKSNPVQNALPNILKDIRTLLGIDEISKKQPQKQKQEAVEEEGEAEEPEDVQMAQTKPAVMNAKPNGQREDDDISMNNVSDDDDDENFGLDLAQFDSRLAPASDASDLDSEASSNDANTHYNLTDDISISSSEGSEAEADGSEASASEFSGFSDSPPPPEPKKAATKTTKKSDTTDKPPKDTTFLPSLMMGGYWSGSEDDGEDHEIDEPAAKPQRKNRMGQQARRALWEKKYGTSANHVKQQQQQNDKKNRNNRNSGWDVRRGATDDNSSNRSSKWGYRRDGGQFDRNNGNNNNNREKERDNAAGPRPQPSKNAGASSGSAAPLHPSWEAARKAKEQKAQASFSGKKIVFD